MEAYYTDEKSDLILNKNKELVFREWPGLFKMTYFSSNKRHAHRIYINRGDKTTEVGVQCEPVQLEIRLAKGNQYGAKTPYH